jgi:hypothetical protein
MPGTAKAAGCCIDCGGAKLYGRRRCIACYGRHKRALKRAGAFTPLRVEGSTKDRLLAHVAAGWGGCILRTVAIDRDGYGLIRESNGKTRRAHRVAYELLVGPIADGLHLDHHCHTRDLSCPGGAKGSAEDPAPAAVPGYGPNHRPGAWPFGVGNPGPNTCHPDCGCAIKPRPAEEP